MQWPAFWQRSNDVDDRSNSHLVLAILKGIGSNKSDAGLSVKSFDKNAFLPGEDGAPSVEWWTPESCTGKLLRTLPYPGRTLREYGYPYPYPKHSVPTRGVPADFFLDLGLRLTVFILGLGLGLTVFILCSHCMLHVQEDVREFEFAT